MNIPNVKCLYLVRIKFVYVGDFPLLSWKKKKTYFFRSFFLFVCFSFVVVLFFSASKAEKCHNCCYLKKGAEITPMRDWIAGTRNCDDLYDGKLIKKRPPKVIIIIFIVELFLDFTSLEAVKNFRKFFTAEFNEKQIRYFFAYNSKKKFFATKTKGGLNNFQENPTWLFVDIIVFVVCWGMLPLWLWICWWGWHRRCSWYFWRDSMLSSLQWTWRMWTICLL